MPDYKYVLFLMIFLFIAMFLQTYMTHVMNNKPHYRAVILVIASNDDKIMVNAKNIWKKYMNIDPTIRIFYVYGNKYVDLGDYDSSCDIVFTNVVEDYPNNLLEKNVLAMEYINAIVSYDYLIRSNLTTFWDFEGLKLQLDALPNTECYAGPYYHNTGETIAPFAGGTSIILSKDMVDIILEKQFLLVYKIPDDVAIGDFFYNIGIKPILFTTNNGYYVQFGDDEYVHYLDWSYCIFHWNRLQDSENNQVKERIRDSVENELTKISSYKIHIDSHKADGDLVQRYLLKQIYNIV